MTALLFLNVVMITRLGYLTRDSGSPWTATTRSAALQLASLTLFAPGVPVYALGAVVVIMALFTHLAERSRRHLAGVRAFTFLVVAVAAVTLLAGVEPAGWARAAGSRLGELLLGPMGLNTLDGWTVNAVAFGALLLTNEVNLLIRYGFQRLNLEPKMVAAGDPDPDAPTDERQYNAGRAIGILERWLIFAALLGGADFAVIAFIVAAKGFARFKQLDRREFAEYILIGTLASTLAAVLTAMAVGTAAGSGL